MTAPPKDEPLTFEQLALFLAERRQEDAAARAAAGEPVNAPPPPESIVWLRSVPFVGNVD